MRDLSKIIILLSAMVAVSVLIFLSEKKFFQLQSISIGQIAEPTREWLFNDIKKKLDPETKAMLGKYVWDVNLDDLLVLIEKDSRVEKVQIKRKFPNKIEVKLLPHQPIAILLSKQKKMIPVARDGTLMPALKDNIFFDAPILRGEDIAVNLALRKQAMHLLLSLEAQESLSSKKISEIIFNKKHGFSMILNPGGELLKMGMRNFKKRVNRAEKVLAYLQSQGLEGRVIDVRFSKKVVVRLRNAP